MSASSSNQPDIDPWQKRVLDIVVSASLFLLTAPVWIVTALAIKLESPGRVFYRDPRIGRGGRLFHILKFRSMYDGAAGRGWNITVEGDARITRVGRFIRKWKIDELPNFVNVLRGEMSIVGPRPEVPEYVGYYTPGQRRVLAMRPGITDLATWSIYRNEEQLLAHVPDPKSYYIQVVMQDKLRRNLHYVDRRPTVLGDMRIIAKTALAIVFGPRDDREFNVLETCRRFGTKVRWIRQQKEAAGRL